ncbi:hypothetical protein ACX93W_21970 [Paenibacillus sp. CAU 1782]
MNSRKVKTLIIAVAAVIAIVAAAIWFFYPKPILMEVKGVQYQLGDSNPEYIENVTILIDGEFIRNLNGSRNFYGSVSIEGETLPVSEDRIELNISFDKNGRGPMEYNDINNSNGQYYLYGDLFMEGDFEKLTIAKYQDTGEASRGWSSEDGIVISGPADNRQQGLEISRELMKAFIGSGVLK